MPDLAIKFIDLVINPLITPLVVECGTSGNWYFLDRENICRQSLLRGGIYHFQVVDRNYSYVGQSRNIWKRWNEHIGDSTRGYGKLTRFTKHKQQAIFMILQFEESDRERIQLERQWAEALIRS